MEMGIICKEFRNHIKGLLGTEEVRTLNLKTELEKQDFEFKKAKTYNQLVSTDVDEKFDELIGNISSTPVKISDVRFSEFDKWIDVDIKNITTKVCYPRICGTKDIVIEEFSKRIVERLGFSIKYELEEILKKKFSRVSTRHITG